MAITIADYVEASLTAYFKEGGLTLASILFSRQPYGHYVIPTSVLKFINEASAKYDSLLERQAFSTISIRAFTHAGSAEREYLGRVAQGFFSFHALGVFGDIALERLKEAKSTVWLIDSNVQISVLALGASISQVWKEYLARLRASNIRLFTTEKLFDETREHWWFADRIIKEHGATSIQVASAARGESPFRRSNLFLEGYINWQAAGNPPDWEGYLFQAFGTRQPTAEDIRDCLANLGVEVIPFQDWPGFEEEDFVARDAYTQRIISFYRRGERVSEGFNEGQIRDPYSKAEPEAEALIIVQKERSGKNHVLSEPGESTPAWFISDTSILNAIEPAGLRITWQPDAFLKFTSTLVPATDTHAAERAFGILLWGFAQSGVSLLDEKVVQAVLGGVIDQAKLDIDEMRQMYEQTLAEKYAEPLDAVMARLDPLDKPMAAIQLAKEIIQEQEARRASAEAAANKEARRAREAERKFEEVESFRKKMEKKKARGRRRARKLRARSKKKRR